MQSDVIKAPGIGALKGAPAAAQRKICTACGTLTNGEMKFAGSLLLEVGLYLFMIIPGFLYTLWRISARRLTCPTCRGTQLVPADSPVGRSLAARLQG